MTESKALSTFRNCLSMQMMLNGMQWDYERLNRNKCEINIIEKTFESKNIITVGNDCAQQIVPTKWKMQAEKCKSMANDLNI